MNEMIKKGIITGVLATTITGTGIYLYGTMNGNANEIRKTTIINQENKIRIDYKQIILDELIEQKQIIIASNKMRIPFTQTEDHWWGSKSQEIEFSAIGRFVVDLDKLNAQDIMVDEESKTITIYMTKPTKIVELLEDETKFGETKKGLFVFGDIEYTLEEVESIKHEVKCDALVEMDKLMEQAKECAKNSIESIIRIVIKDDYQVNVRWVE